MSNLSVATKEPVNSTVLEVPFNDRERAKELGAKWSSTLRKWFVPEGLSAACALKLQEEWGNLFPGEDRTFGGNGLYVDLVPESCWFVNVRHCVSSSDWDKIRHRVYSRANNQCEICGAIKDPSQKRWIEAHERWSYDDKKGVQKLMRLIALCTDCHTVTHFGLATLRGLEDLAYRHLMEVTGMTYSEAKKHVREAFRIWSVRSVRLYELELSLLEHAGVTIIPPS